jgi:flagellar basal body P-ring formation protein FlgA
MAAHLVGARDEAKAKSCPESGPPLAADERIQRGATMNRHPRIRTFVSIAAALGSLAAIVCGAGPTGALPAESRAESVAAIRAAAVAFVRSQLPRDAAVAEISASGLDDRLRLAWCESALLAEPTGGGSTFARSMVAVSCRGPERWRIYVPVTVVRSEPVLILRRAVARDSVLTAADVTVASHRVTGLGTAYLSSPAELNGRTARRTLAAGTALTVDMLTPDLIVHRGQEVTLIAQAAGIEVRAAGQALEDASAGARIHVANASSKKIVEGVVESADTVRVN